MTDLSGLNRTGVKIPVLTFSGKQLQLLGSEGSRNCNYRTTELAPTLNFNELFR